jgi:predicted nucleotidyltransferase
MRKLRNDGKPIDLGSRLETLCEDLAGYEGLVAIYLYGSYGTSFQTPLSDVDLALVFRPDAVPDFSAQCELIGQAMSTLHEDDVSVTVLNHSPPVFQHRILSTGRLLRVTDPIALADFTEEVLRRHGDFVLKHRAFCREYDAALVEDYVVSHHG